MIELKTNLDDIKELQELMSERILLPDLLQDTISAHALHSLINNPHTVDFLSAVKLEAAHQRDRFGQAHDRHKSAEQWFWLVGYLAGKCLRASITGDKQKALHHTISTAAALGNWYEAIQADTTGAGIGLDQDLNPEARESKPTTEPRTSPHDASLDTSEREACDPAADRFTIAFGCIPAHSMLKTEKPNAMGSAEQRPRPEFSARDDAELLKSVARGMSYINIREAVWKHTLVEIAMRLETGGYAPQDVKRCGVPAGACVNQATVDGGV